MSDVATLTGSASGVAGAKNHALASKLLARLATCRDSLADYVKNLPTPPPSLSEYFNSLPTPSGLSPTPPPICVHPSPGATDLAAPLRNDSVGSYEVLAHCAGFVKGVNAAPTPSPSPTALPVRLSGKGNPKNQRFIYVLALASDGPTSARMAFDLRDALRPYPTRTSDPFTGESVQYVLVAEPGWSMAQYLTQCQTDPQTAGAIVALPPAVNSATDNWLLALRSWTTLRAGAIVVDCEPVDRYRMNYVANVTDISDATDHTGTRWSFNLGALLGIASAVQTFRPSSTNSITNTYSVSPTPAPTPLTMYMNETQTTTAGSSAAAAAAAAVAVLSPLSSQAVGTTGSIDTQTKDASNVVAQSIVASLLNPAMCTPYTPQGPAVEPEGTEAKAATLAPTPSPTNPARSQRMQCFWFGPMR